MNLLTQSVVAIGRLMPENVILLGTGFFVAPQVVATTRHVIGHDDKGICILAPHLKDLNEYQDTTKTSANFAKATVAEIDPMRDLATLRVDATLQGPLPQLAGFDPVLVGDQLAIVGFPHATDGRRVLTLQLAELGAKILLPTGASKSKHGILNVQARPGQSGSLVMCPRRGVVAGILVGAYAPSAQATVIMGGIDPRELHQTTHCISAEYLRGMLE